MEKIKIDSIVERRKAMEHLKSPTKMKNKNIITVLENMLERMEEGDLGCGGFSMVETDALRFAINKLKK